MASGPPSLLQACEDVTRAFSFEADPRAMAYAVDSQGISDEKGARDRIDKHKLKIMDRHKTSGAGRVQAIAEAIQPIEDARDLHRGLYVAEGLVLAKKYGLSREVHQSLGMEKDAPPLPPRKGFISTQQLSNSGSRSPHFNRRSVSRSRVRSELTGDTPSSTVSPYSSTPAAAALTPFTRPFGNSFNAAIAARDAMPKLPARTRSNLFTPPSTSTSGSPFEIERARNSDRDRAMTTPSVNGVSHYAASSVTATNRLYDEQLRHSASSSPVSSVPSSAATGSTVVHLPTATLRATAALCGRATGANEVADDVLAEGLVRALNGFQSSYCRLSDGVFRMSSGCAVSLSKQGRMLRVMQMASHALSLNMSSAQGSDLMTEAIIVGIQDIRRQFTQDVMEFERKRGRSLHTQETDLVVWAKWEKALARTATLAALARQPQIKGMKILIELYHHYSGLVNEGGIEERVVVSLVESMMFAFSNLLRQWLLDGTLNVHNTEFVIKERAGHGGEQGEAAMVKSWNTRFILDKTLIPGFLDGNQPAMILSVGKCARLLGAEDVSDELGHHRARVTNLDLTRLYRQDNEEREVLGKELEAIEKGICVLMMDRLLQRDQLKEHLRAIHHIFLCLNERYATHLFESIEVMCRDVKTVSKTRTQHAASLAFISAARTAALSFPFKLPVDAVVKECSSSDSPSPPPSARTGRDRSRISVTPTYKAPRLAAILLNKTAIEHYQSLFHTIWPVYSTRLALIEARNELLFMSDASSRLGRGTSASLRAFQLSMATASIFFDNLIRYFIQGVNVYADRLMAQLDKAENVEQCIKAHKRFLLQLADHVGTSLTGDKRGLSQLTASIQSARGVLLDEASALLDLFWTWVAEAEREQLLRRQNSDEMELGADAQSTTLLEFERLEEKLRREDAEKHQVASSTKIMAIFDRFTLQTVKYVELYASDNNKCEMRKLLLSMKMKRRNEKEQPKAVKQLSQPPANWCSQSVKM